MAWSSGMGLKYWPFWLWKCAVILLSVTSACHCSLGFQSLAILLLFIILVYLCTTSFGLSWRQSFSSPWKLEWGVSGVFYMYTEHHSLGSKHTEIPTLLQCLFFSCTFSIRRVNLPTFTMWTPGKGCECFHLVETSQDELTTTSATMAP